MDNKNKPAMPQSLAISSDSGYTTSDFYGHTDFNGLTKREMFAMHAMQGLLSNSGGVIQRSVMRGTDWCNSDAQSLAELSLECADALLSELEK